MLTVMVPCVALTVPADGGRVEIEGLIISAVARPYVLGGTRPGGGGEYDVEFSVAFNGAPSSIHYIDGPIQVIGLDNRNRSVPDRNSYFGPKPREIGRNRWSIRLTLDDTPDKKLNAVEGFLFIAPGLWKTVEFEGENLKPNGVVEFPEGRVKLQVWDFADPLPDIRLRWTQTNASMSPSPMIGGFATMFDAAGKEIPLKPARDLPSGTGFPGMRQYRFTTEAPVAADSIKKLRLEAPLFKGPAKKLPFRIQDVPIDDWRDKARGRPK